VNSFTGHRIRSDIVEYNQHFLVEVRYLYIAMRAELAELATQVM